MVQGGAERLLESTTSFSCYDSAIIHRRSLYLVQFPVTCPVLVYKACHIVIFMTLKGFFQWQTKLVDIGSFLPIIGQTFYTD